METQDERVTIAVDSGSMDAYLARPASDAPLPAVIEIHAIFGLQPHEEDVARRLAREGYVTLAPNLFWNLESTPDFSDRDAFMRFRRSLDDRAMLRSLDAALAWLRDQRFVQADHIGIVGFCMGGYYAFLEAAHEPSFGACVDFYGAPIKNRMSDDQPETVLEAARHMRVPVLGLFGEDDQSIPVEQVRELDDVLSEVGTPHEVVVYPNAGHAFMNDTAESYRKDAAEDAWPTMVQFFDRYLRTAV